MSNRNTLQSFPTIFLESIDEALGVLGSEPSKAVYQYLSTIRGLSKNEIPERIQEFDDGLKQALGAAAKVIKRLIIRKLFEKLSFTYKESDALEFVDYVNEAKRRFEIFSHKQQQHSLNESYEIGRSKKGQLSS